jgi:flagellum-specific peptidoglycan hydrolase FlgJ
LEKQKFDFSNVADLNLSPLEMNATHNLFDKARIDEDFWKLTSQEFFEKFIRCLRTCVENNAVPSVVCAQSILESGWFSTKSLFGVKSTVAQKEAHEDEGEEDTHEIEDGEKVAEKDSFFEVASIEDNFKNYFDYLVRRKPGTKNFMPADGARFLQALQNPIFAFDENQKPTGAYSTAGQVYIVEILSIIRSNGLQAFDHR